MLSLFAQEADLVFVVGELVGWRVCEHTTSVRPRKKGMAKVSVMYVPAAAALLLRILTCDSSSSIRRWESSSCMCVWEGRSRPQFGQALDEDAACTVLGASVKVAVVDMQEGRRRGCSR